MRTKWKIVVFLAMLVGLYAGYGGIMDWQLTHIAKLLEELHEHSLAVTRGTLSAGRNLIAISRDMKEMILVPNPRTRKALISEIEVREKDALENLQMVSQRIRGEEGKEMVAQAIALVDDWRHLREKIVKAILASNEEEAIRLTQKESSLHMSKIEDTMTKITNYAFSQSMNYRVESITDLKSSNVVLFSGGFIIVILSGIFVLLVARWMKTTLGNTREAIFQVAKTPIDLTTRLKTPSTGGINAAINELLSSLNFALNTAIKRGKVLENQLEHSTIYEGKLPKIVDEILTKFELLEKRTTISFENQEIFERSGRVLLDLFEQIKAELILIAQFAAKQQTGVEALVLEQSANADDAHRQQLDKLQERARLIKRNIDGSVLALERTSDLLRALQTHQAELALASVKRQEIAIDIRSLKDNCSAYDSQLAQIRSVLVELQEALNSIKVA